MRSLRHRKIKPTLETFDVAERVKRFTERGFLWWGYNKLIRRDFLIKNKIEFPPLSVWEDLIFAFQCVVLAKNYVRVPNIIYYYRVRQDSLSHIPKDPFDILDTLIKVICCLDEFMGRVEFFQKNPQWRFNLLDWHIQERMNVLCTAFYEQMKWQPFQVEDVFRRVFAPKFPKDSIEFTAYFFTVAAYQRFYLYQMSREKNSLLQKISDLEMNLAKYKVNSFIK